MNLFNCTILTGLLAIIHLKVVDTYTRKSCKNESRDITVVSAKHHQFCNCAICMAAIYMKHLVKDGLELSELDSQGRPIWSNRRKKRKFVEDKNFDPNAPFFRILDRRNGELELERQDLKQQKYLESIKLLFDNDFPQPANCDNGLLQNLMTVAGTDPQLSVCHEDIFLDIGGNTIQQNSEETVTAEADDEILEVVIADDIDDGLYGIIRVYCNRI